MGPREGNPRLDRRRNKFHYPTTNPKNQQNHTDLRALKHRKSLKVKDFQKITGTLNHAAYGMPGGRGLFTVLWKALAKASRGYVQLNTEVKQAFDDFQWLFNEMANNPVHVAQLVHREPKCNGYSDACKWGAGGVWIIPQTNGTNLYFFWSIPFPEDIIARFEANLLSVNDLELAGVVLHWLVLKHLMPSLQFLSAGIQCDNSSSVAWTKNSRHIPSLRDTCFGLWPFDNRSANPLHSWSHQSREPSTSWRMWPHGITLIKNYILNNQHYLLILTPISNSKPPGRSSA